MVREPGPSLGPVGQWVRAAQTAVGAAQHLPREKGENHRPAPHGQTDGGPGWRTLTGGFGCFASRGARYVGEPDADAGLSAGAAADPEQEIPGDVLEAGRHQHEEQHHERGLPALLRRRLHRQAGRAHGPPLLQQRCRGFRAGCFPRRPARRLHLHDDPCRLHPDVGGPGGRRLGRRHGVRPGQAPADRGRHP